MFNKNNKETLKRVIKYIKKYMLLVVVSFICAALSVAATLYAPILIGDAIDMIIEKGNVDFEGIKKTTLTGNSDDFTTKRVIIIEMK